LPLVTLALAIVDKLFKALKKHRKSGVLIDKN
jgi:hypothetical protein